LGDPLAAQVLPLSDRVFDVVVAFSGGWAVENAEGVQLKSEGELRPLEPGPQGLTAAAAFAQGVLLSGATGLWFAGDAGTALSPLDDAVPGVTDLAVDGDDLWLVGERGLHLWRDGAVSRVNPEGLSTDGARLAAGAGVLWVSSGRSLWRLWTEDAGWQAEVALEGVDLTWIAGGAAGVAWASDGASLHRAGRQGQEEFDAPEHLGLAVAGGDVWLWDADSLWRLDGQTLWPIEGVTGPRSVAALGDGAVIVATADGLIQATVGEPPEPPELVVPTYSGEIAPLFEDSCAICHGERGNARRLDSYEAFSEQIDLILAAVREARMPLPPNEPLGDADIDLLVRWRDADFPE
jgi:hypothetical protein